MTDRSPEEKRRDASRLKFQRDAAARLEYAREQGRAQGLAEGLAENAQIGQIQLLQQMLGLPQTPLNELANRSTEERAVEIEDLLQQFRQRRSN